MTVLGRPLYYPELKVLRSGELYYATRDALLSSLLDQFYRQLRWFDRPLYVHIVHSSQKGRL